ncbi:MAG: hypothetical protein ACRC80_38945 [Waterburya sp.]
MCDYGHQWSLFVDDDEPEKEEHSLCPEGHQAVICKNLPVVDDIQITFRPAGRIVDQVKNQISLRGKYYIVISDISETWKKKSQKAYSWKEAIEIATNFDKRSVDWALKYWQRKCF